MGWSQQNANEFPEVSTTRTIQPDDINMTHLAISIQDSNDHRHKTPAIARCFTFYTTVSPLRRKYMEERRERVIRLSSDSTSFLQNCMIDYFGELWCR